MALADTETGSPTPYQLMPGLTDEERASLRLDIEKHGIRVPIDVDENDQILDGHHRAWIAAELGIPCPRRVVSGLSDEDKRKHAVSVNIFRRNLTREQRRELVGRLRADGMSVRGIANATQLPKSTVADDVEQLSESGQLTDPERVNSEDGRSRPAKAKPLTEEQQAERDHRDAIGRACERLRSVVTGWSQLVALADDQDRDEILAGLIDADREAVLVIETAYRKGLKR